MGDAEDMNVRRRRRRREGQPESQWEGQVQEEEEEESLVRLEEVKERTGMKQEEEEEAEEKEEEEEEAEEKEEEDTLKEEKKKNNRENEKKEGQDEKCENEKKEGQEEQGEEEEENKQQNDDDDKDQPNHHQQELKKEKEEEEEEQREEDTEKEALRQEFEQQKAQQESEALALGQDVAILPDTYWLTRIIFLRFLAFIYAVAFLVALHQNKQLIGDTGLLPVKNYMQLIVERGGSSWWERIKAAPTLLWLAEPWTTVDPWLDFIAGAGLTLACVVLLLGAANVFILLALWLLYHSLVAVGQQWYGFGWESQLLETGLLGVWGVPLLSLHPLPTGSPPPYLLVWGLRWLLFRIMLGAGLIKLRGDSCWLHLTCMNYHYQTQPVPNPLSYYLHQTPELIHKLETLGNHIVELLLPFLTFLPRPYRIACGIGQVMFQVILIISGNLSFLNWLTIVPGLVYFDDHFYARLFTRPTRRRVAHLQQLQRRNSPLVDPGTTRRAVSTSVGLVVVLLSVPVVVNLLSSHQAMNTSFEPFRIVNTYGAFGSITKQRTEVVFEGTRHLDPSSPLAVWEEYEFKCKPGRVDRTPCFISPYHYRLDWLMWFAAFQKYSDNPWLVHLAGKFLVNDKSASSLIAHNPFLARDPPKFVRALYYSYNYTAVSSGSKDWYRRELLGVYLPPLNIHTLRPIFKRMGWDTFSRPASNGA